MAAVRAAVLGRALLYEATGLDAYEAREASVVLPIPAALRRGEASELVLTAEVHRAGDRDNPPLATTRVRVVGPRKPPKRSAAMLLEKVVASDDSDGDGADSGLPHPDHNGEVPHLLYSVAAGGTIELRVVRDETWHATNYLPDGVAVGSSIDHRQRLYAPRNSHRRNSAQFVRAQFVGAAPTLDVRPPRRYAPHFYVEEFALPRKRTRDFSSDVTRPHPNITVRVTPVGLGRFRLMQQVSMTFQVLQEMLGMGPEEFEEVRELLSADRIYRVVLMQVINCTSSSTFWRSRTTSASGRGARTSRGSRRAESSRARCRR